MASAGVVEPTPAEAVLFHTATGHDAAAIAQVQQCVRRQVLRLFVRRGPLLTDDALAMAQWEHGGGFSVEALLRIAAADRVGRERLLRYCARPPVALERLRELDPGQLLYETTKAGLYGNRPQIPAPLQLPGRLAALVPAPRVHRHRYFGVLALNTALRAAFTALAPAAAPTPPPPPPDPPAAEPAHRRAARYAWALPLARFYEFSRSCVPAAVPRCASSPSSPTRPRSATSSPTSANLPFRSASRRPAVRRSGGTGGHASQEPDRVVPNFAASAGHPTPRTTASARSGAPD